MRFPRVPADSIAWLTAAEMVEVDRVTMDEFGIDLVQMMEHAGHRLARLSIERFDPVTVTVLAGSGGNGGGGICAARHLANAGVEVTVTTTEAPEELRGVPAVQLGIAHRVGVAISSAPVGADLVIDALIGYSLSGAPSGRAADLISEASEIGDDIVSLDTPSGLDVTSGVAPGRCVDATATLTLGAPKRGLAAAPQVGELYLADISVPPAVVAALEVGPAPDFRPGPILRIDT